MNNKQKMVCGFLDYLLANGHTRGTKSVFFESLSFYTVGYLKKPYFFKRVIDVKS